MLSPRAAAAMSSRQPCMPGAPLGPVAARTSRRTRVGRTSAISWATNPPIEKPEQVDSVESERVDEREHLPRHRGDRAARLTGRGADARVVDQDDLAVGGERVDQGGVPVVEVAAEVLQQDERQPGRPPETAVGEVDARGLDELASPPSGG